MFVVLQLVGLPVGTNTDAISDARDTPATLVVMALLAVVVAPVVEELLFRGLLLRSLRSRLRPWPAILVQGACFGAIHVQLGVGLENLTVIAALTAVGIQGLTVTEVKGYGRQKGHTEIYRGTEYAVSFLPKLKIEIAVASDLVDRAVEAIATAAKTGQIGDGKIFVYAIDHAVRIRTGETDSEAL